ATVRSAPLGKHRYKQLALANQARFGVVGVAKNRRAARVRVIHGAALRTPREAVGHFNAVRHASAAMVRVKSIETADRFLLRPLVHRAGPEATIRGHL